MKSKQKIIIALVFFGVCSVVFLGVFIYPVFQGVLEDNQKMLAHKKEILQLQEDTKSSREFEMLSGQYAKELVRLEELFVDSETPIAFFRFLDETAVLFTLQIEKAPGSVQQLKEDHWPSFDVHLTGEGLYPNVMAFLEKIENAPYLLEVKVLTISGRNASGQQNQEKVEFSMSLKVFTK